MSCIQWWHLRWFVSFTCPRGWTHSELPPVSSWRCCFELWSANRWSDFPSCCRSRGTDFERTVTGNACSRFAPPSCSSRSWRSYWRHASLFGWPGRGCWEERPLMYRTKTFITWEHLLQRRRKSRPSDAIHHQAYGSIQKRIVEVTAVITSGHCFNLCFSCSLSLPFIVVDTI